MKKTSNEMRFETQIPLRDVMKNNPTMIGIEATVAKAAKAMCHDEVGSVIILENESAYRYSYRGRHYLQGGGKGSQTKYVYV